jgi:predicted aspartyl protease
MDSWRAGKAPKKHLPFAAGSLRESRKRWRTESKQPDDWIIRRNPMEFPVTVNRDEHERPRMKKMGTFRVACKIVHIADSKKSAKVEKLLVDTGRDYTWLPGKVLESIGVERVKKDIRMTMANGQTITRSAGYVIIHSDQFKTVDEVIFAEPDDLSLLGAGTLGGFNARMDLKQRRLVDAGPVLAAASNNLI